MSSRVFSALLSIVWYIDQVITYNPEYFVRLQCKKGRVFTMYLLTLYKNETSEKFC